MTNHPDADTEPTEQPTEAEQTRADLLDLAEAARLLADRAKQLGMRRTARETARMASLLRASRTRLASQPAHLESAQAYVTAAAELLSTIALRIGGAAARGDALDARQAQLQLEALLQLEAVDADQLEAQR